MAPWHLASICKIVEIIGNKSISVSLIFLGNLSTGFILVYVFRKFQIYVMYGWEFYCVSKEDEIL